MIPVCLPCWRREFDMDGDPPRDHSADPDWPMRLCELCGRPTNHGIVVSRDLVERGRASSADAAGNRWTDDHGPDELYHKFDVIRVSTGEPVPNDEFVFVMRPERDLAAWTAMMTYASVVAKRAPNLARQIMGILKEIERVNLDD